MSPSKSRASRNRKPNTPAKASARRLHVLADDYKVVFSHKICAKDNAFGSVVWSRYTMYLDEGPCSRQRPSFLHEILHILDFALTLGLSEDKIRRLEHGLATVWRQNGWNLPSPKSLKPWK